MLCKAGATGEDELWPQAREMRSDADNYQESHQLWSPGAQVTPAQPRSRTTSTVRPWPSHNFFREVLSKTDNVVMPATTKSGSIIAPQATIELSNVSSSTEIYNEVNQNNFANVHTKLKNTRLSPEDKGRSVLLMISTEEDANLQITNLTENVTTLISNLEKKDNLKNSTFDKTMNPRAKSDQPNMPPPSIGFQYEIVVPHFPKITTSINMPTTLPPPFNGYLEKINYRNYSKIQKVDRMGQPASDLSRKNQTYLINRRNMFTVKNNPSPNSRLHVEATNKTTVVINDKSRNTTDNPNLGKTSIEDYIGNQMERPSTIMKVITGPSKITPSPPKIESNYDYFDENNDKIATLHHWIESEQGPSLRPSQGLPMFTNLTWPYYIDNVTSDDIPASSDGINQAKSDVPKGISGTAGSLQVTQKGHNSDLEVYIPSAAASPQRSPVLVAKKKQDKTTQVPKLITWTHVTTIKPEINGGGAKGSKIKQTHWGSQGLRDKSPATTQLQKPIIYEKKEVQKIATSMPSLITSPATNLESVWQLPGGILGHSETASFVTPKTPTNIWYKPTINHFTATLPGNASAVLFDKIVYTPSVTTSTTVQPYPTKQEDFYDDKLNSDEHPENISVHNFPQESESLNVTQNVANDKPDDNLILFKMWTLVDGKLKLQSQRLLPTKVFQGYLIPESGTVLNINQIPEGLQPLVTSEMKKVAAVGNGKVGGGGHVWKLLPILGKFGPTATHVDLIQQSGYQASGESSGAQWVEHMQDKPPVAVNYVTWNKLASDKGQFNLVTTTPVPMVTIHSLGSPVSSRPQFQEVITTPLVTIHSLGSPTPQTPQIPEVATRPTFSTNSDPFTTTTLSSMLPPTTLSPDDLEMELLFQELISLFNKTTPATTTTTTELPLSLITKGIELSLMVIHNNILSVSINAP